MSTREISPIEREVNALLAVGAAKKRIATRIQSDIRETARLWVRWEGDTAKPKLAAVEEILQRLRDAGLIA